MNSQVTTTSQEVQSVGITELEILAQLQLTFNEELRCQAHHRETGTVCSVEVTHRAATCIDGHTWRFICQSAQDYVIRVFGNICGCCHLPIKDCWKIIPI